MTIDQLKLQYAPVNSPRQIDGAYQIEGYVVSQDSYGNFPRTVYIEDETGGIAILVDYDDLDSLTGYGNKVRVYCGGLWLGKYGGMYQLGAESNDVRYPVGHISEQLFVCHNYREGGGKWANTITYGQISERYVGCVVAFQDVQFADEEKDLNWCDPDPNAAPGERKFITTNRHIVTRNGDRIIVRTRGTAKFAGYKLPPGRGWIRGVLTVFNGEYQLVVPHTYHVDMWHEPRF